MHEPQTTSSSTAQTIADQVARQVRKQIILGRLAPGEHLKEVQLAGEFNVSRSTVREVLRKLEGESLVELISHRGARIATFGPRDAVEIYELHALLEGYSIRHVPLPAGAVLLDRLSAVVERMKRLCFPDDVDLFIDLDHEFHGALVQAANLRQVLRVWLGLKSLHGILVGVGARHWQSDPDVIAARHQRIVDALRQGDQDVAASVVGDHYRSMAEQIRRAVTAGNAGANNNVTDLGAAAR